MSCMPRHWRRRSRVKRLERSCDGRIRYGDIVLNKLGTQHQSYQRDGLFGIGNGNAEHSDGGK